MKLEGSVVIPAPRQAVWDFLTDPQAVSHCVPGLQSMQEVKSDELYEAVVSVGFGSMKVDFEAEVEWGERDPLERATISAYATAPGSVAEVSSEMRLKDGPLMPKEIPVAAPAGGESAPGWLARIWQGLLAFLRRLLGIKDPAKPNVTIIMVETTLLSWTAEVTISGRIAATASRLMESVTNHLSKLFFECASKQIQQRTMKDAGQNDG